MEEMRITARRGPGGYEFEAYDADQLFTRATDLLNAKKCREAVDLYDRLAREFPSSRYVSASLYNAGLCLQALGDFAAAAERYGALRAQHPTSEDVRDATFQLAEVLVQLERWDQVLVVSDELLAVGSLSSDERLEAMARRGQALSGLERFDEAEANARGALAYFRTRQGDETIRDEFFAAACNYTLAESFRARAQALSFPQDPEGQRDVLLRRAQLLLEAQREYFNTIQFQNLDNLHWAAASGYRIGHMYDEFWHSIMNAPIPASLPKEGHDVYREELAKFVKPLIRHAIRYWEMTLMMIERTGVKTDWAAKAAADLQRVRSLMLDQPPGPGGLDYVRQHEGGGGAAGDRGAMAPPSEAGRSAAGAAPPGRKTEGTLTPHSVPSRSAHPARPDPAPGASDR
jgi:tetratricopeptide (TPR) repeat protein